MVLSHKPNALPSFHDAFLSLILAFLFLKLLELSFLSLFYRELQVYKGVSKILTVMSHSSITRNFGYIGCSETEFIYFKYYLCMWLNL